DHGEGLGDHGEQTHGMLAYDSTLRVPLSIVAPGWTKPGVISDIVSLADVAGSLLQMAHVSPPPVMSGWFLLSRKPNDRDTHAATEYPSVAGWHPLSALAEDRWKLILSSESELYDLSADPGEATNVAATKAALVEGMTKRIQDLRTKSTNAAQPAPSAEAAERLRALGYVSGAPAPRPAGNAPNPARTIDAWTSFETALTQVSSGKAAAALDTL